MSGRVGAMAIQTGRTLATVMFGAWLALTVSACAEPVVEKAVIVSRHGVRPPTNQKALDPLSTQAWPNWPVPDGDLTPQGAEAAMLMGRYYRNALSRSGLIPAEGCPSSGDLFAWADDTERTKQTAKSIVDGLYQGCGIRIGFAARSGILFHPVAAGVAKVNRTQARREMLAALGGSLANAKVRHAAAFARLAEVLQGPAPQACAKARLPAGCSLIDLPWAIGSADKGRSVTLKGPLDWAGTVGEVLRMEYANGFPPDQVAWGRVTNASEVASLLALHSAYYDATLRLAAIARPNASQLLHQVSLSLLDGTSEEAPGGPPRAKIVLFIGHDTNIATMQAAMGVSWVLPGYPANDTPPAGAFLFERLREPATGERSVRLAYVAQSLDQIRSLAPLTGGSAGPEKAALTLPGCPPPPGACGLDAFAASLRARIDTTALAPVSYDGQHWPTRD
jgi:4-phytase/acid phosphatase